MITSLENPRVKQATKLLQKKYRDETSLFLVEGYHLVTEAKAANLLVETFTSNQMSDGTLVSVDIIKKLSSTETPQPVVGVVKKPEAKELGKRVLVLENIQDPGNVGTLIRSAVAFGFSSVVVQGVDVYSPKVLRSSQGAQFKIPILQTQDITKHIIGYQLVGALLDDPQSIIYTEFKPQTPFMLILGNEGNGLTKETIDQLDAKVFIPIQFESLNVATAGGILMNEYR